MDSLTRNLLRECSLGCKMAINSFNQIRDYVEDEKLKELMDTYDKKHKEYEEQAGKMLKEAGIEEKEPGVVTAVFSRISTDIKLLKNADSSQIAKLLMDGCNMGLQSLGGFLHQYKNASGQSISLAENIRKTEEKLMKEVQEFL